MKVILSGRDQQGWSKEFECTGEGNGGGGCKAVLLVEQADVFKTISSDYDGGRETHAAFSCCACGVLTDIKSGVPFELKSRALG